MRTSFVVVFALVALAQFANCSANTELNSFINGIFEQAGLSDPQHEGSCFDSSDAQLTINTLTACLSDISGNHLQSCIASATSFWNELPTSTKNCVANDPESLTLLNAFGINNSTNLNNLEEKAIGYYTLHHSAFLSSVNTMNTDVGAGEFTDAGEAAAQLVQNILASPGEF